MISNFLKFQGLLVGGVFVHIPFLLRPDLKEGDRISAFRGTEELMLRCGGAFTELLLLGKKLQEVAGFTHRIGQLLTALKAQPAISADSPSTKAKDGIHMMGVSISVPSDDKQRRRLLLKALNLDVVAGQSVLVTGPNGAGKTSLFRVLAGLWKADEGDFSYPGSSIFWLPQKPYLVLGTLRDQVVYPQRVGFDRSKDDQVSECLRKAGLARLLEADGGLGPALDVVHFEWNEVLSGGERQRIGFARLFSHQPAFAVLDEATSAINADHEHELYRQVMSSRCTFFSIAHRLALRQYHHWELEVKGDGEGTWALTKLPQN